MLSPIFNYIITIHNKEDLIEEVLHAVIRCCGNNSSIYAVLDGCTDSSEKIIDKIIRETPQLPIKKVIVNDVHEILSINAGLKAANQEEKGFNIILQDDVIILDHQLENKIYDLYNTVGKELGYVSFRLGANLRKNILRSNDGSPLCNYIESFYGHGIDNAEILTSGQFAFRNIAIKSPVCIPTEIVKKFGLLDEKLAPCFHDDTEYCMRLINQGYKNGVFNIAYKSDLEWGGTRKKKNDPVYQYATRNMMYVKQKYKNEILSFISKPQPRKKIIFEQYFDQDENKSQLDSYKRYNKRRLQISKRSLGLFGIVKFYVRRALGLLRF